MSTPEAKSRSNGGPVGYTRKRARTRRALINAGRAELAKHGPDGATIGEIARRAHVSAGTFYNHFDDLDTLVHTVVDELARGIEATRERQAALETDPGAQLAIGTLQFLRLTHDDPAAARAFVALMANVPEFRARVRATVGTAIAEGVDQRRFVRRQPLVTTDALLGAVVQWMQTRLVGDADGTSDADHVTFALHIAGLAYGEIAGVVDRAIEKAA